MERTQAVSGCWWTGDILPWCFAPEQCRIFAKVPTMCDPTALFWCNVWINRKISLLVFDLTLRFWRAELLLWCGSAVSTGSMRRATPGMSPTVHAHAHVRPHRATHVSQRGHVSTVHRAHREVVHGATWGTAKTLVTEMNFSHFWCKELTFSLFLLLVETRY